MKSSTSRVLAFRERKLGLPGAPLKKRPGPLRSKDVTSKSVAQHHRRDRASSREALGKFVSVFLRLRIIAKVVLECCSDVRRQLRLASALQENGASLRCVCLLMLFDRPLRDSRLSKAMLLAYKRSRRQGMGDMQAAWSSISWARWRHAVCGSRSAFWLGPTALNASFMVRDWQRHELTQVVNYLTAPSVKDTRTAVGRLCSLPYMGVYHAYGTLRTLRLVTGLRLRAEHTVAGSMSFGVSMLSSVMSIQETMEIMKCSPSCKDVIVRPGDAAMALCETKKALTRLGLIMIRQHRTSTDLAELLSSARAEQLLSALETCQPLSETALNPARVQRHKERQQLDSCLPHTREKWDRHQHYAVGSEDLASIFLRPLRRRGWVP